MTIEKLFIPKEPKNVKELMRKSEECLIPLSLPGRKRNTLVIWHGHKLPQYLWNTWKERLKAEGMKWQKFLELMKFCEEGMVAWYQNKISWDKLVEQIIKEIKKH